MRLALLTAAHGRHALTRKFAKYYADWPMDKIAVCSSEEDAACFGDAWHVLIYPNEPLGRKWNEGLDYAKGLSFDALMLMGSDDFVNREYLDFAQEKLKTHDHLYFEDLYIYDDPDLIYIANNLPGAGRVLSRSILDRCKWKLWHDGINSYLDGSLLNRIRPRNPYRIKMKDEGLFLVDIKSDQNLWELVDTGLRQSGTDHVAEFAMTRENPNLLGKYGIE